MSATGRPPPPGRGDRPFGRVAVLGLGVMGGSVARGLSGLGLAERVTGWAPMSTERDAALTARAITFAAAEWREAVVDADLVVLAVPLKAAVHLLTAMRGVVPGSATITDLTSLKEPVAVAVREAGLTAQWVGSHPMAGSEASGFWASRADIFEGARVWIVSDGAPSKSIGVVDGLWTALGGSPQSIDARDHDRLMALASHLPQLTANALATVLQQSGIASDRLGPGGRDMTRLAGSSPAMWADLLDEASPVLVGGLRSLGFALERLADLIERGDVGAVHTLMRQTRDWKSVR